MFPSAEWPVLQRPGGSPVRVLIVDDEAMLSEMVSFALRSEGWETSTAANGAAALATARSLMPDVVVLDVMLPDMSGLDLLPMMRAMLPDLPVLLLTARDAVEDRIAGFRAGGDDYVTKPFSIEEVVLRVRSLLRRAGVAIAYGGAQITVGDLVLDEQSHEVTRSGVPISLTYTEFKLLKFLMFNSRRVVSKSQILAQVWSHDFDPQSNLVGLYISYLRKKVDWGRDPMIHTLRGSGYVLKPTQ